MKLSNAALFLVGTLGTFGHVQAAAASKEFELPDSMDLMVKVHNAHVCDADTGWGKGKSDAYVKVSAKFKNGSTKSCGRTHRINGNSYPNFNRWLNCGTITKSKWGDGVQIYLEMMDYDSTSSDDGLGRGSYHKWFKYGERTSNKVGLSSSQGSKCGYSTVWFTMQTPTTSHEFCLQEDPTKPFSKEKLTNSYHSIEKTLASYETKGWKVRYAEDVETVDGEPVKLDGSCSHTDYVEVTVCTRDQDDIGEMGKEVVDQDLLPAQKALYMEQGVDVFSPGDKVTYLSGVGTVQNDCSITADGATSYGDPHFKTWSGKQFDFHGGCDMILLSNPSFANGLGLTIHVRTQIQSWWSLIEAAVVQIGDHTVEVHGGKDEVLYYLNGEKEGRDLQTAQAALGDFPINFHRITGHQGRVRIDIGDGDAISIETFKKFVRVNIKDKSQGNKFAHSAGLLGSYPFGEKVARDGKTIIEAANEFGQEWMVKPSEPRLFHDKDSVEPPLACPMPEDNMKTARRRLAEAAISEEDAAMACARINEVDRDACTFDVLATNDAEMAGSY